MAPSYYNSGLDQLQKQSGAYANPNVNPNAGSTSDQYDASMSRNYDMLSKMIASSGKAQEITASKMASDAQAADQNPAGGIMQGAAIGSVGGPWGALIGGAVGGLIGLGKGISAAAQGKESWGDLAGHFLNPIQTAKDVGAAMQTPSGQTAAGSLATVAAKKFAPQPATQDPNALAIQSLSGPRQLPTNPGAPPSNYGALGGNQLTPPPANPYDQSVDPSSLRLIPPGGPTGNLQTPGNQAVPPGWRWDPNTNSWLPPQ